MSSEEDGIPSECLYFYIFSSIVPPGHPGSLGLQSLLGGGESTFAFARIKGGSPAATVSTLDHCAHLAAALVCL